MLTRPAASVVVVDVQIATTRGGSEAGRITVFHWALQLGGMAAFDLLEKHRLIEEYCDYSVNNM